MRSFVAPVIVLLAVALSVSASALETQVACEGSGCPGAPQYADPTPRLLDERRLEQHWKRMYEAQVSDPNDIKEAARAFEAEYAEAIGRVPPVSFRSKISVPVLTEKPAEQALASFHLQTSRLSFESGDLIEREIRNAHYLPDKDGFGWGREIRLSAYPYSACGSSAAACLELLLGRSTLFAKASSSDQEHKGDTLIERHKSFRRASALLVHQHSYPRNAPTDTLYWISVELLPPHTRAVGYLVALYSRIVPAGAGPVELRIYASRFAEPLREFHFTDLLSTEPAAAQ